MNQNLPCREAITYKFITDSYRKILLTKLFGIVGVLLAVIFGIDAILRGEQSFGIFLLAIFACVLSMYVYLWKTNKYKIATLIMVLCMLLANTYLLVFVARTDTTAPLWHYISPPIFLFATNRKTGAMLILSLLIVTILSFELIPELRENFSAFYKVRFYACFFTISALSYIYEFIREKTYRAFISSDKEKTTFLKQVIEQNEEILQQKEEIITQSDLLSETNRKLEKTNRLLTSSINYAKNIQESILPDKEVIRKKFPESFIFFRPRDIVSGDFYWYSDHGNKQLIAAVDCTGHGVPGAFMSMIGNTLLNEIVNEKGIHVPSVILNHLNSRVIFLLAQRGTADGIQDDGMDISICCIDRENNRVTIACANQSVCVFPPAGAEMELIKGCAFSIGERLHGTTESGITDISYDCIPGTVIYLYTDGFSDQFGEEDTRKFMAVRFRNLLKEIHKKPMADQNNILISTFEKWKSGNAQIDDVLVIGIRI